MIEESKYCSEVIKKHFNKELVMTRKDNDIKVTGHCHIARTLALRDCNINLKLNHKSCIS